MDTTKISYKPIEVLLRVLAVSILLFWCFLLTEPFLIIIIWSVIIAVSLYPLYAKLLRLWKGKRGYAISTILLVVLVLFAIPTYRLSIKLISNIDEIAHVTRDFQTILSNPDPRVKEWPLVGNTIYSIWDGGAPAVTQFYEAHSEQIAAFASWFFGALKMILMDLGITIICILAACYLMFESEFLLKGTLKFAHKLTGKTMGDKFVFTARDTIKSVVQGILLVAVIQAFLAYIGFAFMDIAAAPLLAILILFLAIIQLPVILVTLPIAIYVFTAAPLTTAIIFGIYLIFIGLIDNILKPIFLARGVEVPMLVIFGGSIGGLILHGIIGLFLGPVILAIGYQTYEIWVNSSDDNLVN
jgi:predicted PurR-regulated permease PerM